MGNSSSLNILSGGDFTVECWFYATSLPLNFTAPFNADFGTVLVSKDNATSTGGWLLRVFPDNVGFIYPGLGGASISFSFATNTWYHVAAVRHSNNFRFFINGAEFTPGAYQNRTTDVTNALSVGQSAFTNQRCFFNGYIDDLRITKGVARYTGSFTPPQRQFRP